MKKIKITTPENIEVEYDLADLGSRTAAAAIDTLIQSLILLVLFIGIMLVNSFSEMLWERHYGIIIGVSLIIFALISYGYFIVMELTMNGMTLGKKVLRIRTIRNNGQPITFKHSAIRNLFRVFIDMAGIGVIFMFFSKEHKRVGDYVASTIVVLEDEKMRPITLEQLENTRKDYSYYMTNEELEILRDYFARKNGMEDCSILREELKEYFTNKFLELGILDEWQKFIDEIVY